MPKSLIDVHSARVRFVFRRVAWLLFALLPASANAQLTLEEVEFDRAQMDALRARLMVAAPFAEQPTMTTLSPGRSGGIEGSVKTSEHNRLGTRRAAPSARLAWVAQLASPQSRLDVDADEQLHLLAVGPSSDVASGATPRLLVLEVLADGRLARLDTAHRASASVPAGDLAFALGSDHEQIYDPEDWMVFDLLHEALEVRICDDLSKEGATVCHDSFAQLTRRPNAPQRYQVKLGCMEACGEALFNLEARYRDGRLDSMSTNLLLGDDRVDIAPEVEIIFRSPASTGQLSPRSSGRMILSREQNVTQSAIDWTFLYSDAHPSRLDPLADRSPSP